MNHTSEGFNQTGSQLMQRAVEFSPVSLAIAAVVIIVGLLLLRFVVKTAFTLVKVAIVVLIGIGAYLAFQAFL